MDEEQAIIEANVEYERLVRLNSNNLAKMQVVTDSLLVAKEFVKKHKNVLRDIRNLEEQLRRVLTKDDFHSSYLSRQIM